MDDRNFRRCAGRANGAVMRSRWLALGIVALSASAVSAGTSIDLDRSRTTASDIPIQLAQRVQAQQQQRAAPRAAPTVQRAPTVRPQQPMGHRGSMQQGARPGTQAQPGAQSGMSRSGGGGSAGAGVHGMGGGGMAAPQTPRSQLYDLVRPAPVSTNVGPSAPQSGSMRTSGPAPGNATRAAVTGTNAPRAAEFSKPAHVSHNPTRKAGTAGFSHGHRPFVFRRAGYVFYRHYYVVSGVWYFYEAPVESGDPAFALADDPDTPVCEEDADECN